MTTHRGFITDILMKEEGHGKRRRRMRERRGSRRESRREKEEEEEGRERREETIKWKVRIGFM